MFAFSSLPGVRALRCFLAVAHYRNYRQAADELGISQPPLTRQIQNLEAQLGTRLFIRDTHRVTLTHSGERLEQFASRWLQEMEHFIPSLTSATPLPVLGMTSNLDFRAIPPFAQALARPEMREIVLSEGLSSRQLLNGLLRRDLDLALVGERVLADPRLYYQALWHEPLMLALPEHHPAAAQPTLSPTQLADLPLYWFARRENPAFYDKCEAVFATLDIPLTRQPEAQDTLRVLAQVARGEGYALLPASVCSGSRPGLCYRPLTAALAGKLNITVFLARRQEEQRTEILAAASAIIKLFDLPLTTD
ncbi:LysR family transcriptional regulator [Entomohabitans teleogrylli]|uniref:LysR substrate-binding domain-containing protein n=1 Tax=Entomohabitans teleogrylli TaxID=1384589 RepID=UPI00073D9FA2|nr:LysR family transcriptional regulator [Entomohabitans teleogrylli]